MVMQKHAGVRTVVEMANNVRGPTHAYKLMTTKATFLRNNFLVVLKGSVRKYLEKKASECRTPQRKY